MNILNKDDIRAAGGIVHSDGNVFFTNIDQLNAAILQKLAGAEVPGPFGYVWEETWKDLDTHLGNGDWNSEFHFDQAKPKEGNYEKVFTLDQLQAYGAACAARQLSSEPVFWYRPRSDSGFDGPLHDSILEPIRKKSGAWIPLYTKEVTK